MKNIMAEAPEVSRSFFNLTNSVTEYSKMDLKTKELILIGIFTTNRGIRGINTHVIRALEAGATKEEVLGAILLALPAVGISNVTLAFEKALEIISQKEGE
ncbi:carboxymuconolactone decarboxylase family protein [Priestia megaterium]|uniref:carboxymuconolactone decarboxylase family protein n=1 Tax=Priestia megaterium TaxID=1404 RepID=UPI000BF9FE10|nr:carboxymuconolactone decarboxylase family protein [Priestia megaterium]PFL61098.1 alkylhydroperoxidase [Priestia megaterium]